MAKANKAYQYRLYPTSEQKIMFEKTFGCCRKVYNLMLHDKITSYNETGKNKIFTPAMYKKEYPYLKEVDSLAFANEQMHLQAAFKNFWRDKRIGFPKYKSKKNDYNSYTTNRVNGNICVMNQAIKLPKVGVVRAKIHRSAPDTYKMKSMTVSEKRDGTYYVSVLYEYEPEITPVQCVSTHIGLDYASHGLYVDSNGAACAMPSWYRRLEPKLAKAQRRLSRKANGSKNYKKQKRVVARISRHIANQRKDFLHKKSNEITNRYDLISVESLNLHAMTRFRYLGKATLDNGYGIFLDMLAYKQKEKGHFFVKVDKFYPSSQLCNCGFKNPITKNLSVRMITCPFCGRTYDRDVNAALNIDKEGYRLLTA